MNNEIWYLFIEFSTGNSQTHQGASCPRRPTWGYVSSCSVRCRLEATWGNCLERCETAAGADDAPRDRPLERLGADLAGQPRRRAHSRDFAEEWRRPSHEHPEPSWRSLASGSQRRNSDQRHHWKHLAIGIALAAAVLDRSFPNHD